MPCEILPLVELRADVVVTVLIKQKLHQHLLGLHFVYLVYIYIDRVLLIRFLENYIPGC